jgi:nucleotide-binding universal stress UspA family protein
MKNDTPSGASQRMFEKIVVAVDVDEARSRRVVSAAAQVAIPADAAVRVALVQEVERSAALVGTPRAGALPPALPYDGPPDAARVVEGAVERFRHAGLTADGTTGGGEGSTARELLQIADSFGASLIVIGDSGSRVADFLFGGVARKTLRDADCSVLLVR